MKTETTEQHDDGLQALIVLIILTAFVIVGLFVCSAAMGQGPPFTDVARIEGEGTPDGFDDPPRGNPYCWACFQNCLWAYNNCMITAVGWWQEMICTNEYWTCYWGCWEDECALGPDEVERVRERIALWHAPRANGESAFDCVGRVQNEGVTCALEMPDSDWWKTICSQRALAKMTEECRP